MKCKNISLIILIVILVSSNLVVYGNESIGSTRQSQIVSSNDEETTTSLAELYHRAGLDSPEVIINVLVNLGISYEEIEQSIEEGKKTYDILQEKQVTMRNFKKALNKEYKARIRQAKKSKIITRQEAKTLTRLLKERMDSWEV